MLFLKRLMGKLKHLFVKHPSKVDRQEAEIQAIKEQTHKKIEDSRETNQKLLELLEANGIAFNIWVASGGGRKHK